MNHTSAAGYISVWTCVDVTVPSYWAVWSWCSPPAAPSPQVWWCPRCIQPSESLTQGYWASPPPLTLMDRDIAAALTSVLSCHFKSTRPESVEFSGIVNLHPSYPFYKTWSDLDVSKCVCNISSASGMALEMATLIWLVSQSICCSLFLFLLFDPTLTGLCFLTRITNSPNQNTSVADSVTSIYFHFYKVMKSMSCLTWGQRL